MVRNFYALLALKKQKTPEPKYQKIYSASQEKAFGVSTCKAPLIRVFKHENFIRNDINIKDRTDIDERGNLILNKKVSKNKIVLCSSFGIPVNIPHTYGMSEFGLKLRKYLSCYTTNSKEIKKQKYLEEQEIEIHIRNKHTK